MGEWRPRKRLFDDEAALLARALDEFARLQVEVETLRERVACLADRERED